MKKLLPSIQNYWNLNQDQALVQISGILLFFRQFKSPVTLLLIAAAILSAFLDDVADILIILIIVMISSILGFWQERAPSSDS